MSLDTQSEPSPDVLRSLHSDYLRQLRISALGWSAVAAVGVAIAISAGGLVGPLPLALLIAGGQAAKTGYEWWREARIDPVAAGSATGREALELERDRVAAFKERLRGARVFATWTLAGIVVLVTIIEWLTAGNIWTAIGRAGLIKPLVSQGEWWRLVTSTFVHANLIHLAANMGALLAFGRIVETLVPRAWVVVTYLTAGIAGSLASWWLVPDTASLGASGAVMGLVGFLAAHGWRRPDKVPAFVREITWAAILMTGFSGALLFFVIDNAAHGGGLVAGALVALAFERSSTRMTHPSPALRYVGAISMLLVLLGAGRTIVALADGPLAIADSWPFRRADHIVPVSSVSVARTTEPPVGALISNSSDRVLEAYEIEFGEPGSGPVIWRDACCIASEDGVKSVHPGESSRIPIVARRNPLLAVSELRIRTAVFADGSFEGSSRGRDQIIRRRQQALEEAAFWMWALDLLLVPDPARASDRLTAVLASRAKVTELANPAATAFGVPTLLALAKSDPASLAAEVARTKEKIAAAASLLEQRARRIS